MFGLRKSKRFICALLCAVICFVICSCDNKQVYIKQEAANLNYNNISAGTSPYWIDKNGVFFKKHELFGVNVYMIDQAGKSKITTVSSLGRVQQSYNGRLYLMDEDVIMSEKYILTEYDLPTKKQTTVATVSAERIYEYYILDNILYVVTGKNDDLIKDIQAISLDTNKVTRVAQDVFACGIADGALRYIVALNNEYIIYEYKFSNNKCSRIGGFEAQLSENEIIWESLNFTSDSVVFYTTDEVNNKSRLLIYNIDSDVCYYYNVSGTVENLVAYDKYAFIMVTDHFESDSELQQNTLYHFCIDTQKMQKVSEFKGWTSIFVTSDYDVYVSSTAFENIVHCTSDGLKENIIKF